MGTERRLPPEVADALGRLDQLVGSFERHPDPDTQASVFEMLQRVDVIHRTGLRRMVELLTGTDMMRRALAEPEIRLLFELYGLGESGDRARVEALLDNIQTDVALQGARLELLDADDGVIVLRLSATGRAQPGPTGAVHQFIEQTLREALPDFKRLEIRDAEPTALPSKHFVPISSITHRPRSTLVWELVCEATTVPVGGVQGFHVAGEPVMIANLDGKLLAYRNACPGTPLPLHGGRVEGGILHCPWHQCRFDLSSGKRVGGHSFGLTEVPISIEAGEVWIGLRRGAAA